MSHQRNLGAEISTAQNSEIKCYETKYSGPPIEEQNAERSDLEASQAATQKQCDIYKSKYEHMAYP